MPNPTLDPIESGEGREFRYEVPPSFAKSMDAFVLDIGKTLAQPQYFGQSKSSGAYARFSFYGCDVGAGYQAEDVEAESVEISPMYVAALREWPLLHFVENPVEGFQAHQFRQRWPDEIEEQVGSVSTRETDAFVRLARIWRSRYLSEKAKERPVIQIDQDVNYRAIGELLAIIDADEFEWVHGILDGRSAAVGEVVNSLGLARALRLANLLGRADAAVVHDNRFFATALGISLGKTVASLAESEA